MSPKKGKTGNPLFRNCFIALIALICLRQGASIVTHGFKELKTFVAHADYGSLRRAYPVFAAAQEAKEVLPSHANVGIAVSDDGIDRIAARYSLSPLKIVADWDYFIDLTGQNPAASGKSRQLASGAMIYARPGLDFSKPAERSAYPSSMILSVFFMITLGNIVVGALLLNALKITSPKKDLLWTWTTSYLLGFFLLTAVLWVYLLCGGALTPLAVTTLAILTFCALIPFSKRPATTKGATLRQKKDVSRVTTGLTILLTGLIVCIFLLIIATPVRDWDSMSNWMLKAKVIFYNGNLTSDQAHNNYYPILWPLNITTHYTILGGDYDEVAKFTCALLFLAFLVQIKTALSLLELKRKQIVVTMLIFLGFFFAENPFNAAMAENAFLAFLAGLIVALLLWINHPQRKDYFWLAVIMAAALNLIKFEGFLATWFAAGSLVLVHKRKPLADNILPYAAVLSLTAILPLAWMGWVKMQGMYQGVVHLSGWELSRIALLMKLHLLHFIETGEWIILAAVLAYLWIFPNPRRLNRAEIFLLSFSIFLLGFKGLAMAGWSRELLQMQMVLADASWRMLLHAAVPLTLLLGSRNV